MHENNIFLRVFHFYLEGFKNMKLGKTLWLIIIIKLIIMFGILRVFFFRDYLSQNTDNKKEIPHYVGSEFINRQIK